MKKVILNTLIVSALLAGGCKDKDLINPIPTTSITDASAFDTKDKVESQVRALYGNLKSGQFYGGRYLIYNDIRGEEFINNLTNGVTALSTWNHSVTNTTAEVNGLWSQAYFVINTTNVFIDGMNTKGTSVVGTAVGTNYIAEARLIRALTYYSLLQLYARPYWDGDGSKPGIPLRLNGNKGSNEYALARSTVGEVYTQILADLSFAENNLPVDYTGAVSGVPQATMRTTRAHRNTAIALKTRVYLSMRKYTEVITEANKIVSAAAPFTASTGAPHKLETDITNVFKTPYTSLESIFSLPMSSTSGDNPGTQNQLAYYYSPTSGNGGVGNGEYYLNTAGIQGNAGWLAGDKRRTFIKSSGSGASTRYWLNKYGVGSPYTDWVPVIRYAEVLLNLAEARVRSTNTVDAQAVALLNAVRNRSDATVTYTAASFANAAALLDAILTERRIEFLGEGLRSPDLLRTGAQIPSKSSTTAGPAAAVNPADKAYIWPISGTELDLNKLMTDN